MLRSFSTAVLVILALTLTLTSHAGDKKQEGDTKKEAAFPPVKQGPEHTVLRGLAGVFDAKVKMFLAPGGKASESKGVMTRKMILGGNYLQESFQGEFLGSPFSGMGILGFDQNQQKYVTTWVDSMSTSMLLLTGTYNPAKKTFTMLGEDFDPSTKKKMKARDILKIMSANVQTFEMYRQPDGAPAEIKVMEITFTKRSQKKKESQ